MENTEYFSISLTDHTFTSLNDHQRAELMREIEDLVLKGIPCTYSKYFRRWCHSCGYDERQSLLAMATAYPQRALLSLLRLGEESTEKEEPR